MRTAEVCGNILVRSVTIYRTILTSYKMAKKALQSTRICKAAAVIWCALLVHMTCAARCRGSAVPAVVISACTSAYAHPLPCSQSPMVFSAAISMWRPTYLPHTSQTTSTGSVWLKRRVVDQMLLQEFVPRSDVQQHS